MLEMVALGKVPSGWNDMTGRVVRVLSIKLSDAQKRPDSALVKTSHFSSALHTEKDRLVKAGSQKATPRPRSQTPREES